MLGFCQNWIFGQNFDFLNGVPPNETFPESHLKKISWAIFGNFSHCGMSIEHFSHFLVLFFSHDVIPIVMGARPEDYAIAAPTKSYIHVDDFDSPKELADYLHKLDQDDQLYNEYFKWKVRRKDSTFTPT